MSTVETHLCRDVHVTSSDLLISVAQKLDVLVLFLGHAKKREKQPPAPKSAAIKLKAVSADSGGGLTRQEGKCETL